MYFYSLLQVEPSAIFCMLNEDKRRLKKKNILK